MKNRDINKDIRLQHHQRPLRQAVFLLYQMNWKVDEPEEYKGNEKSSRFEQLLFRALIEDQISMSKVASLSNQSLAEFKKEHQHMF